MPPQFKLTKDHITAQTLRIEGDGDLEASYSGRLLLIASQESASPPLALPIVPARAPSYSDHLLLIGAALGLAPVLFGSVAALIRFGAGTRMRDVAWASNSWASNAGVISAALASMIAFVAASDARLHLSNSEYTFLVAAFGAPLVLAPVLFNALRRACPDGTVRGVNGGYILASGATMLGTQLELTLLAAHARRLEQDGAAGSSPFGDGPLSGLFGHSGLRLLWQLQRVYYNPARKWTDTTSRRGSDYRSAAGVLAAPKPALL